MRLKEGIRVEFKVVRASRDKDTLITFHHGHSYVTDDVERALYLKELGHIVGEIKGEGNSQTVTSLLDGNADEVKKSITAVLEETELESLLQLEVAGKNRKTVIEHIKELLNNTSKGV